MSKTFNFQFAFMGQAAAKDHDDCESTGQEGEYQDS